MEETITNFVAANGLVALFVLMILDNIGVPFPSEIPLLLAGFFVRDGQMDLIPAIIVTALGSLVGALILYELGRRFGRAILTRFGRVIRVTPADLARAEDWFHRRGEPAVFYLRVVPLARTIISIPAGMLRMRRERFIGFTLGGSLLWNGAVIAIGFALGASYERVLGGFGIAGFAAASTIGMVIVIWVVNRWRLRREDPPGPSAAP